MLDTKALELAVGAAEISAMTARIQAKFKRVYILFSYFHGCLETGEKPSPSMMRQAEKLIEYITTGKE